MLSTMDPFILPAAPGADTRHVISRLFRPPSVLATALLWALDKARAIDYREGIKKTAGWIQREGGATDNHAERSIVGVVVAAIAVKPSHHLGK